MASRPGLAVTSVEPLETRTLFALQIDAQPPLTGGPDVNGGSLYNLTPRGTLVINGTGQSDVIRVDAGRKSISFRGVAGITFSVNRSAFKRVRVEAGGGRDNVAVLGNVGKPLTINGGTGNDVLSGGSGAETIHGGAGHDVIRAFATGGTFNAGDVLKTGTWTTTIIGDTDDVGSLLAGGRGDDTIVGSPGHDTIRGDAGRDVFQLEFTEGEEVEFGSEGPLPQGDDDLASIELTVVASVKPITVPVGELGTTRGTLVFGGS